MTTNIIKIERKLTFEQFIEQLPDDDGRYELINGEIVRILATRQHEDVADFIQRKFDRESERLNLNYQISNRITIRTITADGTQQGRRPDVSVVDKTVWEANRAAYSALLDPLLVAVEVVSTNWEDDYVDKLDEYKRLGISEYWIVDYLALASRNYLGNPKVPTVFIYLLDENGNYQVNAYQGSDKIVSRAFPELDLTAEQIFQA
jgi:Uma2 family endonuclease